MGFIKLSLNLFFRLLHHINGLKNKNYINTHSIVVIMPSNDNFEIIEKGLELTLKVYTEVTDPNVQLSASHPEIELAYRALLQRMRERGWVRGDNAVIELQFLPEKRQLYDLTLLYILTVKPEGLSGYYH